MRADHAHKDATVRERDRMQRTFTVTGTTFLWSGSDGAQVELVGMRDPDTGRVHYLDPAAEVDIVEEKK